MDEYVKPPHYLNECPTLCKKLQLGRFITIIFTNEKGKRLIRIAKDVETT
jgi:hypothetical protein